MSVSVLWNGRRHNVQTTPATRLAQVLAEVRVCIVHMCAICRGSNYILRPRMSVPAPSLSRLGTSVRTMIRLKKAGNDAFSHRILVLSSLYACDVCAAPLQVCAKIGEPTDGYTLKFQNKNVDLSTTVRLANIPNNAKLELIKSAAPRSQAAVQLVGIARSCALYPRVSVCTMASLITIKDPSSVGSRILLSCFS